MTKAPAKKSGPDKTATKSSPKAKPAKKAATVRASTGGGKQVHIGMYGVARILKAIHEQGPAHEQKFIADLSNASKHVTVDSKTFAVMKHYTSTSPIATELDDCGSDPYNICFGRHSSWRDVSGS
jgi:hypothetical protein